MRPPRSSALPLPVAQTPEIGFTEHRKNQAGEEWVLDVHSFPGVVLGNEAWRSHAKVIKFPLYIVIPIDLAAVVPCAGFIS